MAGSIFLDKDHKPTADDLIAALGNALPLWNDFAAHIRETCAPIDSDWSFYKSWHWRLKRKARTVCYLFPVKDGFTAAFVFGEKAVAVAQSGKLPEKILKDIEGARKYAEGRGFYVDCRTPADLVHLKTLTAIKMETK